MRRDLERLQDILESIAAIERYATQGRQAFDRDELIRVWMVHHIQIIGEAVAGLTDLFREKYATVPWSDIIGMRNILVHEYFGIDPESVWGTVIHDLPVFKSQVSAMFDHEKSLEEP